MLQTLAAAFAALVLDALGADARLFQRGRISLASFDQDWALPLREKIVQPMVYDQRLLVCNAFQAETDAPISLSKNGDVVFIEGEALAYEECRYAPVSVRKGDKLDFATTDNIAGGTFEVTDLPEQDAMLLLVLQNSMNQSFPLTSQSFTFPLHNTGGKAKLAVVDATAGRRGALLHIARSLPTKDDSDIDFNQVYELDNGTYSVSLQAMPGPEGAAHDLPHGLELGKHAHRLLNLQGDRDYVLLRIGGERGEEEHFITFPGSQSGSAVSTLGGLCIAVAALAVALP